MYLFTCPLGIWSELSYGYKFSYVSVIDKSIVIIQHTKFLAVQYIGYHYINVDQGGSCTWTVCYGDGHDCEVLVVCRNISCQTLQTVCYEDGQFGESDSLYSCNLCHYRAIMAGSWASKQEGSGRKVHPCTFVGWTFLPLPSWECSTPSWPG